MLALTEKEKKAILQIIKDNIEAHAAKYPADKFPEEPLTEWRKAFTDAKSVQTEQIKQAIIKGSSTSNQMQTLESPCRKKKYFVE